ADTIAGGVTSNDLDFLKDYLPRILAVTPEQVQKAAKEYFDPEHRVVVWSVPKPEKIGKGSGVRSRGPEGPGKVLLPSRRGRSAFDKGAGQSFSFKNAERVVLPN